MREGKKESMEGMKFLDSPVNKKKKNIFFHVQGEEGAKGIPGE